MGGFAKWTGFSRVMHFLLFSTQFFIVYGGFTINHVDVGVEK
jgi:hypothetical protein